jgi:upstream activation factor subunit UAF30
VRKRGTPAKNKKGKKSGEKKRKSVSKAVVDSADDSEVDTEAGGAENGEKKVRKGGFHKPMVLSATLSEFLGGETTVSLILCPLLLSEAVFADMLVIVISSRMR